MLNDEFRLYDLTLQSRLLVGTAQYPSPSILKQALTSIRPGMITLSLRRQTAMQNKGINHAGEMNATRVMAEGAYYDSHDEKGEVSDLICDNKFWDFIKSLNIPLLPNTAGCYSVKEAITVAQMSREVFETNFIKVEITGDDYNLQPDPFALVEACEKLIQMGFNVLPYCTEDLVLCQRLLDVGCEALMPWGAPIGTGKGLMNPYALSTLRARIPDVPLLVDAGIGKPSDAAHAMELGFDGILLNTAIAHAGDPVLMAQAFEHSVQAGRMAHRASLMQESEVAQASTPIVGTPFWHHDEKTRSE